MTNPQYDQEEACFLKEIGLDSDDLTSLVKDAPDVPADVAERVRGQVRRNLAPRRATRRLWATLAAAVAGVALVGTLVSTGAAAALVERLYRLVPGMGVTDTGEDTLVLEKPVAIAQAGHDMEVLGLLSNPSGTLLRMRWTGATQAQVPIAQRPWLILQDGTRLQTPGGNSSLSNGMLQWNITFAPLPAGTRSVRLELPPIAGITAETVTADLPLSADVNGLARALPTGNPSVELHGVRVSVPSMNLGPDTIQLAVKLEGAAIGGNPAQFNRVSLSDDLGNSYQLDYVTADFAYRPGLPSSFTFIGPVQPGAQRLKLTIDGVITPESGSMKVNVAVGDLAVGSSMPLNQEVVLGPVSFRITQATRLAESKYRLVLEPGVTPEGYRLYGFSTTSPTHTEENPALFIGVPKDGITVELYTAPVDGLLTFHPVSPGVIRQGPYVLEIPLQ